MILRARVDARRQPTLIILDKRSQLCQVPYLGTVYVRSVLVESHTLVQEIELDPSVNRTPRRITHFELLSEMTGNE